MDLSVKNVLKSEKDHSRDTTAGEFVQQPHKSHLVKIISDISGGRSCGEVTMVCFNNSLYNDY